MCNHTDLCNEDSLLPLSTTTTETKTNNWVSSTTTKLSTKKEPRTLIKGTTHRFSPRSSAQINKHKNNVMALTILNLIIYFIF